MRAIVPTVLVSVVAMGLHAETTGRIQGRVTTKAGAPIAKASIVMKRVDISQTRTLETNSDGKFTQVGLEPKEFEVTVSAPGFQSNLSRIKIPLGDAYTHNVTLLTMEEARAAAPQKVDPSAEASDAASSAWNEVINLYKAGAFAEALPLAEKAYSGFQEAVSKAKDEETKGQTTAHLANAERVYLTCMVETGRKTEDAEQRKALFAKAEPMALGQYQKDPKNTNVLGFLVDISKAKGDTAAAAKYQGELDAINGPNPGVIYNKGVDAFNGGNMGDAKTFFLKAIELDPKYAEAYYLLAMCEANANDLKACKGHLLKYLELAPSGKNAGTAKEMLNDPSIKKIKL